MKKERFVFEIGSLHHKIKRKIQNSEFFQNINKMTGTNCNIILFLADNSDIDIFQKDIQEHFDVTRSTMSKVLSLMEKKDLIQRKSVSYDSRLKKIVLTKKALNLSDSIRNELDKFDAVMTRGFSNQELDMFYCYINRVNENIDLANIKGINCD